MMKHEDWMLVHDTLKLLGFNVLDVEEKQRTWKSSRIRENIEVVIKDYGFVYFYVDGVERATLRNVRDNLDELYKGVKLCRETLF